MTHTQLPLLAVSAQTRALFLRTVTVSKFTIPATRQLRTVKLKINLPQNQAIEENAMKGQLSGIIAGDVQFVAQSRSKEVISLWNVQFRYLSEVNCTANAKDCLTSDGWTSLYGSHRCFSYVSYICKAMIGPSFTKVCIFSLSYVRL
ncbi:hypothetical protein BSL78_02716 [Apostichopus japonicus]|uniref:Uncharacterized protein n=1 Tax=Stichopus japonicus TaxID=307972 RepID=A0A2G8LJB6_STIJA|nr:hypothetical protein BSL78_02716 [Apostichopus japonicus]